MALFGLSFIVAVRCLCATSTSAPAVTQPAVLRRLYRSQGSVKRQPERVPRQAALEGLRQTPDAPPHQVLGVLQHKMLHTCKPVQLQFAVSTLQILLPVLAAVAVDV